MVSFVAAVEGGEGCHHQEPEDDEPTIPVHHMMAFSLVVLCTSMLSGAMTNVGMEYRQVLGVTVFFQTLTTLVVGPAMGYAALTFGYISDHIDSDRFGRRKPLLLPLMLLATTGLIMYFTPPQAHQGISIQAWYFISTLLYKVRALVAEAEAVKVVGLVLILLLPPLPPQGPSGSL